MIRNLFLILLTVSMFTGCSGSKKKGDDGAAGTDVLGESDVSSEASSFDPQGSDSGNVPGLFSVTFGYDQAQLTSEARRLLKENAEWIKSHPEVKVQIEGHCDERGSIEYNLFLGERRAKTARDYLIGLGVDANQLSIISYGKEKPLDPGDSESAYARNRRANFAPLP